MKNVVCIVGITLSLAACGGGGNSATTGNDQAITHALAEIGAPSLPYAMVYVNGQQLGYVHGATYGAVAEAAAKEVASNATKYPEAYRALISSSGMGIVMNGSGKGNDINAVATLSSGGKIDVFVGTPCANAGCEI